MGGEFQGGTSQQWGEADIDGECTAAIVCGGMRTCSRARNGRA